MSEVHYINKSTHMIDFVGLFAYTSYLDIVYFFSLL